LAAAVASPETSTNPTDASNQKSEFVYLNTIENLNTSNQSVSNEDSLLSPLSQNIDSSLLALKNIEAQRR
jgi:hypothetical protein